MILTKDLLDIPESKDFSELILEYVAVAENFIWKDLRKVEVLDDAKIVISYLLFERLEDFLSAGPYRFYKPNEYFEKLRPALLQRTQEYAVFMGEMLDVMSERRQEIGGLLKRDWTQIVSVANCGGDLHNHGRCTLIIETDAGKLIYKPRDCGIDDWFYKFAEQFAQEYVYVPKVLRGANYGLFEFVENEPAAEERAGEYFRNLGRFCALARMLGATDLHRENLLAKGTRLVTIDLETILAPVERLESFNASMDVQYDRAEYEQMQTSLRTSALQCNALGEEQFSVLYDISENNPAAPQVGGRRVCVNDFRQEFETGFTREYGRLLEQREALQSALEQARHLHVRTVIRNTREYAHWIEQLESGEKSPEEVLQELRNQCIPELEDICGRELEEMERGDIPYFCSVAGTLNLGCGGCILKESYFERSAVENAFRRLETGSDSEMTYELELLRKNE